MNKLYNDLSRYRTWWGTVGLSLITVIVGVVLVPSSQTQTANKANKSASAGAPPAATATAPAAPPSAPVPASASVSGTTPTVPGPVQQSTYTPTDTQALRLENAQLKAQLAQSAYATASQQLPQFAQFQSAIGALQAECRTVISESKWPTQVQCDISAQPVRFCEHMVMGANGQQGCPVAVTPVNTESKK